MVAALLYNRNNAPFDSSYFKLWINLGLLIKVIIVSSFRAGFIDLITAAWHAFWSRIYYYELLNVTDVFAVHLSNSDELPRELQPNSTMVYLRRQVGFAGMHYFSQLQYVGVAVMAVNRYTGVARPVAHNNVLVCVVDLLIAFMLVAVEGRSPEIRVHGAVHFRRHRTNCLPYRTAQSGHSQESGIRE